MSNEKRLNPEYGPLSGLRIVGSGTAVAMPTALSVLGDFGAEVIQIERPGGGDAATRGLSGGQLWHQEGRNRLSMSLELDLSQPEIKEVFMDLIRSADVFMENQVWLDKFGIYDEELLEVNPELVIIHVSGYGREEFGGDEDYIGRASYDVIGQAFSGYLSLNGTKERPIPLKPYTNDFVTALWVVSSALMGLRYVEKTGKGQVIDISQYEAMARLMAGEISQADTSGRNPERNPDEEGIQPFGLYEADGGEFVAIASASPGVYSRVLKAIGFDKEEYPFGEVAVGKENVESEKGQKFDQEFRAWVSARSAEEIEKIMNDNRVPCSKVNTMLDILDHPHFEKRNNIVEYENRQTGKTHRNFGVFPHMSESPGKIWRGASDVGEDTEAILEQLGYTEEQIKKLQDKNCI